YLALLPAIGKGDGSARDRHQAGADKIHAKIVQLLLSESLAGQSQLNDRHARGAIGDHQRGRGSRWQLAQLGLGDCRDLRDGFGDFSIRLKKNLYHRHAIQRLRLDVLNVIDQRGEGALGLEDDAARHVRSIEAGVVPDYADYRNINVGKNVGR